MTKLDSILCVGDWGVAEISNHLFFMLVGVVFQRYLILCPFFKSVEICRILFQSLFMSKSIEICRFLRILVDLYRIGVDCLDVVWVLILICVASHSTVVPST
jgi:hypothetical protein